MRRRRNHSEEPEEKSRSQDGRIPTKVEGPIKWHGLAVNWWLLHVVAVGWVIAGGLLAHHKLHTHEECDMTYSWRWFYEIDLKGDYKLYRFTDLRDPRHAPLQNRQSQDWCLTANTNKSIIPVLFIPGHGGNYQQGRSLGAHGLRLTGSQSLDRQYVHRFLENATSYMDVFSIDFHEEGTALHGFYFQRQTEYVKAVIEHLIGHCKYDSIAIVAHSMGGLVARSAAADLAPHVHAIVTLGTPHVRPILTWEPTAISWHEELRKRKDEDTLVVSIAGGLRDDLIPPETCQLPDRPHFLSFSATDIMDLPQDAGKILPMLGMDHKAIVWCHNVLSPVRKILLSLHETRNLPASERLDFVKSALGPSKIPSIPESMIKQQKALKSTYGFFMSLAMETSLIYHAEWIIWFYSLLGASVAYFGSSRTMLTMAGSILLTVVRGGSHSLAPPQVPLVSTVLLCLTAHAAFSIVQFFVGLLAVQRNCTPSHRASFSVLILAALTPFILGRRTLPLVCAVLVIALMILHLTSLPPGDPIEVATTTRREVALVAWMLPFAVLAVGSDLIVSVVSTIDGMRATSCLPLIFFTLLVAVRLQVVPTKCSSSYSKWLGSSRLVWMVWLSLGGNVGPLLSVGIHPVFTFFFAMITMDILSWTLLPRA